MSEEIPTITIEDESMVEEYVSFETPFTVQPVPINSQHSISISWWFSPFQFYTFFKHDKQQLAILTKEMQQFYRNKKPVAKFLQKGSYVIALSTREKKYYRAKIIDTNAMLKKYKVYLVDIGFTITIAHNEVFEVEKRFTELPHLVNLCSLQGIISNKEHSKALEDLHPFMNLQKNVVCEFLRYDEKNELYIVNLTSNGQSVIEEMSRIGSWSIIGNNVDVNFLKLQQIRATVVQINSMLEFKIRIEGFDFPLMCSYDDFKYARANPGKEQEFKEYYENKSFVMNVTHVTADEV